MHDWGRIKNSNLLALQGILAANMKIIALTDTNAEKCTAIMKWRQNVALNCGVKIRFSSKRRFRRHGLEKTFCGRRWQHLRELADRNLTAIGI